MVTYLLVIMLIYSEQKAKVLEVILCKLDVFFIRIS
jgi:hypothetical protein